MADGDSGCGIEPADTPNESKGLVTVSIESDSPDSGGIPHVCLGSTTWHAGDANGHANGVDALSGQVDESRRLTDVMGTSNRAETDGMSNGEGAGTYLGAGDMKRVVDTTNGVGNHTDTSSRHSDVPNVQTNANKPANMPEIVSIP